MSLSLVFVVLTCAKSAVFGSLNNETGKDDRDFDVISQLALPSSQSTGVSKSISAQMRNLNITHDELLLLTAKAKNISHSKGPYVKNSDDSLDIRRSILRKASVKTYSEILNNLLHDFKNDSVNTLAALKEIEHMVHQYDVAVSFTHMGGMELILPLLSSPNKELAGAAVSVLGAAMQGNPVVQRYAMKHNVGNYLVKHLSDVTSSFLSRTLVALSSYLRNAPESQEKFYADGSMSLLSNIVKPYSSVSTDTQLKVINLICDLAVERRMSSLDAESDDQGRMINLHNSFITEVRKYGICNLIVPFLSLEDFDSHQKVIAAMNAVRHVCLKDFLKKEIELKLRSLLKLYDPQLKDENPFYPKIDVELKEMIYTDIVTLFDGIFIEQLREKVNSSDKTEL